VDLLARAEWAIFVRRQCTDFTKPIGSRTGWLIADMGWRRIRLLARHKQQFLVGVAHLGTKHDGLSRCEFAVAHHCGPVVVGVAQAACDSRGIFSGGAVYGSPGEHCLGGMDGAAEKRAGDGVLFAFDPLVFETG
jgi:hypothetical protein